MHRRTVTILLLLTLATLVTAAGPPGEPPDPLAQAKQLADAGQYEQAEQLYQAVLAEQPGPDQALAAQKGLAILYVRSGQDAEAKQALEDLIAGFSDHWDIARAVTHVADACRETGKHSDALETYDRVIAAWPDDEHALWSQMNIAMSQACLKDANASDAALEELCSTWQGHDLLGQALCFVADNWRRLNTHDKARDVYTRALASDPDPEFAMWSRMGLTISGIHLGDVESAEADADRLISDFSADPRSSIAACLAADQFRASGVHEKAAELYKYVVDNWPQSEHAIWSQMGLAICHIYVGDEIAADEAAERLVTNFADRENLGQAVEQVVRRYRGRGRYDEAEQLCRRGAAAQASRDFGPLGKANVARMHILAGDDQAAEAIFSKVLADYAGHKLLPEAVHFMAEGFWNQAMAERRNGLDAQAVLHFQAAAGFWEAIIRDMPDTPYITPTAHRMLGDFYRHFGQYEKAIECYQTVIDNWPEYEYAPHLLSTIRRTRKHMQRTELPPPKPPEEATSRRTATSQKGGRG